MSDEFTRVPALFMRGGTSKGVYLMLDDLPADPQLRDRVILDIYGSPDIRQINGMGGADTMAGGAPAREGTASLAEPQSERA